MIRAITKAGISVVQIEIKEPSLTVRYTACACRWEMEQLFRITHSVASILLDLPETE